jgi:hypothetical protein
LPAAVELYEDTKAIARQNLLAVSAAERLRNEFDERGLALVFLKGLTLGALAYPQAMVKMSTDVDVLVDAAEIEEAEKCLGDLGYELEGARRSQSGRSAASKEWTWVGDQGVVVDLHVRLADSPDLLPGIGVRGATQAVEVSPGIMLQTLPREELFAYLCVHGTTSAWFRLKWAADLAAFISSCGPDDIRRLYRTAVEFGAGRCPDVALLVLEELFGPLIPSDVSAAARQDPVSRLLARLSLREMMQVQEPLDRPLGTVLIHLGQLFTGRGLAFPAREFRRKVSILAG